MVDLVNDFLLRIPKGDKWFLQCLDPAQGCFDYPSYPFLNIAPVKYEEYWALIFISAERERERRGESDFSDFWFGKCEKLPENRSKKLLIFYCLVYPTGKSSRIYKNNILLILFSFTHTLCIFHIILKLVNQFKELGKLFLCLQLRS